MTVLHHYTWGDPGGPPLVAVHGVSGHARRFERAATTGWPHRRTLAVDLRGHGLSTWDPPWSLGQHVCDVLDTVDLVGLETFDVVGHSFGAAVALGLLAAAPDRLGRLVLLDPAIAGDAELMRAKATEVMGRGGHATERDALIARIDGSADPAVRDAAELEIVHHLERRDDGTFWFRYDKAAVVAAFGEICQPVPELVEARPTLVVAATRAPFVTPEMLDALGTQLGDLLEVVELDCGHMVMWERLDETVDLVDGFLD